MATISHKDLPNAQLHEPKGVSAASAGTVYKADGAGSGSWTTAPYTYSLTCALLDISTASTAYVVAPVAGVITKIYNVIEGAITVADSILTCSIGGTPITNGSMTVAYSGSAAGDIDSATPTANATVSAGSLLKVATDGGSTTTAVSRITFLISVPT